MIDATKVKEEAQKEFQEELVKKAKETLKVLMRKRHAATQVVANIDREIADAYADIGDGTSPEPASPSPVRGV